MLTLEQVDQELNQIAKDLNLPEAEVHAEQSGNWYHVLISSPFFEGKSSTDRNNLIWREFERRFDDDTILSITQCYLLTPEEKEEAGLDLNDSKRDV